MATTVFTDAFVEVNGTDLSAQVQSLELTYQSEMLDATSMGDTTRVRVGGLKDWSATVNFFNDFAASSVDDTLFPLVGTVFNITIRPINANPVSATNPNYGGDVILQSYPAFGGEVGATHTSSVSFRAAGDLARTTA